MKALLILGVTVLTWNSVSNKNLSIASNFNQLLAQTTPIPNQATTSSPLLQAGRQLLSWERYELASVMEVTADLPGALLNSQIQINTIVEAPNKINSQITFVSPNGLEGKAYEIISDGSQVWIYDPLTNQYSVSPLPQFLQTREGFLIGTLSHFYVSTRSNIGSSKILANVLANLPEERLIGYFQRFSALDLQNYVIRDETLEETAYKAYDLQDPSKGLQATLYVNPSESFIERVHLSGTKDGRQLTSKEKIINHKMMESIAPETFSFAVPDNAQQVSQQLSLQPF